MVQETSELEPPLVNHASESLSGPEWFNTLNAEEKRSTEAIILEGELLFPHDPAAARLHCLNKTSLTRVQYDWLHDLRPAGVPMALHSGTEPAFTETLVIDVSLPTDGCDAFVPNEPAMTPSSPPVTPAPATSSTAVAVNFALPPPFLPTAVNSSPPILVVGSIANTAVSGSSPLLALPASEPPVTTTSLHLRVPDSVLTEASVSNVDYSLESKTIPELVAFSVLSNSIDISSPTLPPTSAPLELCAASSSASSFNLGPSPRSSSHQLSTGPNSPLGRFSDSCAPLSIEELKHHPSDRKHDDNDNDEEQDRKVVHEDFDYKSDFRKLLHVAIPSESDSFLSLCASVKDKLDKTTDDPEVLRNWSLEQAEILNNTITTELGSWFDIQHWEKWHQEVKLLKLDQNLLEMFQLRLDTLCQAEMIPAGTNMMNAFETGRVLSQVTDPHAIPFYELVRRLCTTHYFLEPRKKTDPERIATKIAEYMRDHGPQGYAFVKDMIGVRLYFTSAEEAVHALKKFHKEQDKQCVEYLSGPPCKRKNFAYQNRFAILQIKPKLTTTLRNIHVVLGTFDHEGVPIIGEVQFAVSPTQENAFAFAKLHALYEIERVCENKQKISPEVTRELCSCINKLYHWGLPKNKQDVKSPRLFLLVEQQLKLCDQLRKKLGKVQIARVMFSELDVCLEEFEQVLNTLSPSPNQVNEEGGLCAILENLRDVLLDTQEMVVKCCGKSSESLLRSFYNENFRFEEWWSQRDNSISINSDSSERKNDNMIRKEQEVKTFLQTIALKTATLYTIRTSLKSISPLQQQQIKERKLPDETADVQEIDRLLSFLALVKTRGPSVPSLDLGSWLDHAEIADNLELLQLIWAQEFRSAWQKELEQCGGNYYSQVKILREKLQEMIKNAKNLIPMLKKADVLVLDVEKVLEEEMQKIEALSFQLAVVGPMKSGKTTIINALIGLRLLPERTFPMTMFCTVVRHIHGQREPVLSLKKDTLLPFARAITQIRTTAAAMGLGLPLALPDKNMSLDYQPEHADPFAFLLKLSRHFQSEITEYFSQEHNINFKRIDIETLSKEEEKKVDRNENITATATITPTTSTTTSTSSSAAATATSNSQQPEHLDMEGMHLAHFLFEKAATRYYAYKARKIDEFKKKQLEAVFHFGLGYKDKEDVLRKKLLEKGKPKKIANRWKNRVAVAIEKVLGLQSMEKQVFQSILNGTLTSASLMNQFLTNEQQPQQITGTEPCCQAIQLLTMIARVAAAFGLQNPACLIDEKWPEICVHFRSIDFERPLLGDFSLIDTPGPDEATEADLSLVVNKVLKNANAVLCVLNSTTFQSKAEEEIKKGVYSMRQLRNHQIQNLTIVCNKFDIAHISIEDAKHHVTHQFGVPSSEVYFASGKLACLSNDIDAYFDTNNNTSTSSSSTSSSSTSSSSTSSSSSDINTTTIQKPVINFQDDSSVLTQWALICFGNRPAAIYNRLTIEDLKLANIEVKKDSRIEFLMDRILNNMVCRAGCLVMENSIHRIEVTFEAACNNCDSKYASTSCGANEAKKELDRLIRHQWNAETALVHWNLTSNGVKTERDNEGHRALKIVEPHGVKFLEEYITQQTSDCVTSFRKDIQQLLLDEFKVTPENYFYVTNDNISEFRESDFNDHVLRFPTRRALCRRLRQISIKVFQFVQSRFHFFVNLLRTVLDHRLDRLNKKLNSDILEVDPVLARLSLHNESIANTVADANPLCAPKNLVERSRLQNTKKRLWYTLFLVEGEVKGTLVAQAFLRKVEAKWFEALDDLMASFSKQILDDFRGTIERQRLVFFKACHQQFKIRKRRIFECQSRLNAPQSHSSYKVLIREVAEVKLSLFYRLKLPIDEIRFWTERV